MIHNHSSGKHRLLKKILAVCMVFAMICSVSISAFAVEASSEDTDEAMQSVMVEESDEQTAAETETGNEQAPDGEQSEVTSPEEDVENPDSDNEEPAPSEDNEQPADSTDTDQPEEITVTPEQDASVTPSQEDAQNSDVLAMDGKAKKLTPTPTPASTDGYFGEAAIYYLANPADDPWTNDTGAWAPDKESSQIVCQINTTGATWEDGYGNNGTVYEKKNIKTNVASYITSWPDGSTGTTWTVKRDDEKTGGYFTFILDSIWGAYKTSISKELGIDENRLEKTDIQEITVTPRKISRDNGGEYLYHVDCALSIKSTKIFTAKFWVKEPGSSEYTKVDAKNYKKGDQVIETTKAEPGSTTVVDGVTYVLDGWYPENGSGEAYGNNKILDSEWPYTPSATELSDGTVNFYAHYTPLYTSVNIKKLVTGSMGDRSKAFHFKVSVKNGETNLKFKNRDQSCEGTADFSLTNGQNITLTDVPVGATVTVTEDDYKGNRYTTSWTVDGGNAGNNSADGSEAMATISNITKKDDGSAHEVVFTNRKDAIPDTGLTLGTTPYILALGIAVAGAVLLLFGRRKRQN